MPWSSLLSVSPTYLYEILRDMLTLSRAGAHNVSRIVCVNRVLGVAYWF